MFFDLMFFPSLPLVHVWGSSFFHFGGSFRFVHVPLFQRNGLIRSLIIIIITHKLRNQKKRERVEIPFYPTHPNTKKARSWLDNSGKKGRCGGESTARGRQGEGKVRTADFETD